MERDTPRTTVGLVERSGCPSWTLKVYRRIQALSGALAGDSGQDLVEYALLLVLIALMAAASVRSVATSIGAVFTAVGAHLSGYTS